MNVRDYERKGFTQFGETGIIEELCKRLDPPKYFVEIGIESGKECMTRDLIEGGWCGRQIEAREDCWRDAADLNMRWRERVWTMCERVDLDNIEEVLAGVPRDHFGLLSIDVDGNDFWFWQAICQTHGYKPQIVVIEANHHIAEGELFLMPYDETWCWDGHRTDYGASLSALQALGQELGYTYVGVTTEGVNAFFVRNDVASKLI